LHYLVHIFAKVYYMLMSINYLNAILAGQYENNKRLAEELIRNLTTVSRRCTNGSQFLIDTSVRIAELLNVDICDLFKPTKTNYE